MQTNLFSEASNHPTTEKTKHLFITTCWHLLQQSDSYASHRVIYLLTAACRCNTPINALRLLHCYYSYTTNVQSLDSLDSLSTMGFRDAFENPEQYSPSSASTPPYCTNLVTVSLRPESSSSFNWRTALSVRVDNDSTNLLI